MDSTSVCTMLPGMTPMLAELLSQLHGAGGVREASAHAPIFFPVLHPRPTTAVSAPIKLDQPPAPRRVTVKRRINRGRAFKAHKGAYNVVVDGQIVSAESCLDALRTELTFKQTLLGPCLVNGVDVCVRLQSTVNLLPFLNNPSLCGAVIAGHLFPRDFFVNHILRDADGNVKAAKGFINYSNREPLSKQASKLFFQVLHYFGGAVIEPKMLESWLWVARKGVNDRGNTSKSGRGVRYFVPKDYEPVLKEDIWLEEERSLEPRRLHGILSCSEPTSSQSSPSEAYSPCPTTTTEEDGEGSEVMVLEKSVSPSVS